MHKDSKYEPAAQASEFSGVFANAVARGLVDYVSRLGARGLLIK